MNSLDIYVPRPEEMTAYLARHGWHFSKKAFTYATGRMRKKNDEKVTPMTYDEVEEMLKRNGITVKNDNGYDKAYVAAMIKADYMGSAIEDEQHLAMAVRDYLDDPDGYEEKAMRQWYCDTIAKGHPIPWEELI